MRLEQTTRLSVAKFTEWRGLYLRRETEFGVDEHEPIHLTIILGYLEPLMREIGCRIGNRAEL